VDRYEIEERTLTAQPTACVHLEVPVSGISTVIGPAYGEIAGYLAEVGVAMVGMPVARYYEVDTVKAVFDAGFPVASVVEGRGRVQAGELPGGPAIATLHVGPYDTMGPAYEALEAWAEAHGRKPGGAPWEVYLSDPAAEPDPQRWRTEVVLQLAT
jgi:effector-binding domain-containing protein